MKKNIKAKIKLAIILVALILVTIIGVVAHNNATNIKRIAQNENTQNIKEQKIWNNETQGLGLEVTEADTTTKSITVKVVKAEIENASEQNLEYKYYIKQSNKVDYPEKSHEGTEKSYTYNNLVAGEKYDVKVVLIDKSTSNQVTTEIKAVETKEVPNAQEEIEKRTITASTPTWNNGKATVTLSTTTGLSIEYQVNTATEDGWKAGKTVNSLNKGDILRVRLSDGSNKGNIGSITIGESTQEVTITTKEATTYSMKVEVASNNKEYRKETRPEYSYYIKESTVANYPTTPTHTGTNSYTFSDLTSGTDYDVKVVLTNKAGNQIQGELKGSSTVIGDPKDTYVTLYTDGTLAFSNKGKKIAGKTVQKEYGNIKGKVFNSSSKAPWYTERLKILTVTFNDTIIPESTAWWFYDCTAMTGITNINNLDTSNVTNMSHMFSSCSGLTSLDLSSFKTSKVTDMSNMFSTPTLFLGEPKYSQLTSLNLSGFNTSNVTNMSGMFMGCIKLTNLNLSSFKTSKVTDMSNMFDFCQSLTSLNLNNFDTSNVTNMNRMFGFDAKLTNLDLSSFKTSKVTDMGEMFTGCPISILDITNFETSNVTEMYNMFYECTNLTTIYASDKFVTTKVTDSNNMFYGCTKIVGGNGTKYSSSYVNKTYARIDKVGTKGYFTAKILTGDITTNSITWENEKAKVILETTTDLEIQYKIGENGEWKTGKEVTGLKNNDKVYVRLTDGTNYSLETIINITDSTAPTSTITLSANNVKPGATITAKVTHTDNQSGINTTSCKYIYNTTSAKIGTTSSSWNTAKTFSSNPQTINLTTTTEGTYYLHVLTVDKAGNKTETVSKPVKVERITDTYVTLYTDGTLAFSNGTEKMAGKTVQKEYGNIKGKVFTEKSLWNSETSNIKNAIFVNRIAPENTALWFDSCSELTEIQNMSNLDTSNVTDMNNMFWNCKKLTNIDLRNFDTSKVTNMWGMFSDCSGITSLDVSKFNTSQVTNMWGMFQSCSSLTSLDLSNFNTSKVTDMHQMFYGCRKLESLNLTSFNTSQVTNMFAMFHWCNSLTNLDVSHFNTSNVTKMGALFLECKALTKLNVSNFDTSKVTDMSAMFSKCTGLTSLNISNFDTSQVTNMLSMFYECTGLTSLDLINFNTSKVTNMSNMFNGCTNLKTIYASDKFVTTKVTDSNNMFYGCTKLVGGNKTPYSSSYVNKTYARIDKAGTKGYFTAKVLTGNITTNSITWSGGKATVTLGTTTGLTIQYKIGSSGTWTTGTKVTGLNHGDVVYARLTDGTIYSAETTINVTDSTAPTSTITLSTNNVKPGATITAKVTHTDNQSGINTTSCKYIYNTTSAKIGTTSSSWNTAKTFSSNPQTINLTTTTEGTYYLHVLTVDKAGNKTETVSQPVKVEKITNVYVTLYIDGTLAFSNGTEKMAGKTVLEEYGNIKGKTFTSPSTVPWYADRIEILTVIFNNRVAPTSTAYWFYGCILMTEITNINNLDTSNVTNMSNMFCECEKLTSIDVSKFNTSKVTNMSQMFQSCYYLTNLDVSNFDTSNVTNMRGMFSYCENLTNLDVSKFNTSKVTDMTDMFRDCYGLTNLDVSKFNTTNVTAMNQMFNFCSSLTSIDVSKFNTTNVKDMSNMFSNCEKLTSIDVSKFNTSKVTNMNGMFARCTGLTSLDLINFNTSNVTDTDQMFADCTNLKTIYASDKFVTTKVTNSTNMFTGCTKLVGGNKTPYSSSYVNKTYARIDKVGTKGYFTAKVLTGNITTSSITWSSGTASVTLGTTTGLTIQYKIGSSGTWKTGTKVTGLRHGNVVYARLTDGTNYSAETTINILDNTPPTITIIQEEVTSTSIKVRVVATDGQSGMPTNPTYQYGIKETSSQFPCVMINQGSSTTYTWSELTPNTSYNISVQTSDAAGNLKIETITVTTSAPQTIYFTINGYSFKALEGDDWVAGFYETPQHDYGQAFDIYLLGCTCGKIDHKTNHTGTLILYDSRQYLRDSSGRTVSCRDKIIANERYVTY